MTQNINNKYQLEFSGRCFCCLAACPERRWLEACPGGLALTRARTHGNGPKVQTGYKQPKTLLLRGGWVFGRSSRPERCCRSDWDPEP